MKRLSAMAVGLLFAVPSAHAATTWQGSVTIYSSTVECRNYTSDPARKFNNGQTFRGVLKPAGVTDNGDFTDLSFIALRSARSYRLFNWDTNTSSYISNGGYEMRGIQGFGRWTGNTVNMAASGHDGFESFAITPVPATPPVPSPTTKNVRIVGWINDFSNVSGCNIYVRGTFVR